MIRIHVWGWKQGGERIWTNFEAHGFSIFRTRHCWFPMLRRILIYLFKLKINLTPFSLPLSFSSPPSMAEETRRNSVDILHGIIRTRGPLRPIHTIHYTRQGYLLRDAVQLCIRCAHPSSVPLVSLFTDTCSFHWHDARITEERISLEPYKARIAGKFNVLRAL